MFEYDLHAGLQPGGGLLLQAGGDRAAAQPGSCSRNSEGGVECQSVISPSSSLVTASSSLEVAVVVRLACSVTLTRPDTVLLPAPSGDLVILDIRAGNKSPRRFHNHEDGPY